MASQAEIEATLALAESRGFHMQNWSGAWVLTSGPPDQRLCTECGRWRKLRWFTQAQSVCDPCNRVRGRLRYAAKKIKERRRDD